MFVLVSSSEYFSCDSIGAGMIPCLGAGNECNYMDVGNNSKG